MFNHRPSWCQIRNLRHHAAALLERGQIRFIKQQLAANPMMGDLATAHHFVQQAGRDAQKFCCLLCRNHTSVP